MTKTWSWDDIPGIDQETATAARASTLKLTGAVRVRELASQVVTVERTRLTNKVGARLNPVTTGEHDLNIKAMADNGHDNRYIADHLGCSYPTLMKRLAILREAAG